jgi:hypothetical protein
MEKSVAYINSKNMASTYKEGMKERLRTSAFPPKELAPVAEPAPAIETESLVPKDVDVAEVKESACTVSTRSSATLYYF